MSIVMPFNPNSAEFIDEIARRWGRVVVPFFTNHPKRKAAARGFGSGFIASYRGVPFLVTAKHVIEQALEEDCCVINVDGRGIILENLPFHIDRGNDLAFTPMDRIFNEAGLATVQTIDLERGDDGSEAWGYHLLLGYPGTKNKLEREWGKVNRQLLSLTLEPAHTEKEVNSDIEDPILFDFHPKQQVDSFFNRVQQPPDLHGMSGGPTFELRMIIPFKGQLNFHMRLSGVLVEQHPRQGVIVAATAKSLVRAIENIATMTA